MRRAARSDNGQQEIVKALRKIGATVQMLHQLGKGTPDVLAGYRNCNVLLELKDGTKPPSARTLTADEKAWHESWAGQVVIADSVEDAVCKVIAHARECGKL